MKFTDFRTGTKLKKTSKDVADQKQVKSNIPKLDHEIIFGDKNSPSFLLQQIIYQAICEVFQDRSIISLAEIKLEHPKIEDYGDFASNIAMVLSGKLKRTPFELAKILEEKISQYIKKHESVTPKITASDILEKVKAVKPGFLNLFLSEDYLFKKLYDASLRDDDDVRLTNLQGKKVAVEYTDPNPFKEFHLGHLYSNFIGETIALLLEACGATVWRGDFYGDVGMHIAKSVYGLLEKLKTLKGEEYLKEIRRYLDKLEKLPISQRQKLLGEGYALGVVKYEEDKKIQEEIKDMNYLIYITAQEILKKEKGWQPIIDYGQYVLGKEDRLKEVGMVYEAGLRWSLEYFETIYKKLGTKFDGYYPESLVGEYGMKLVEKGLKTGVLEKAEGAVIYRGEKDGLHTRVFVNKLGLPTYEAKDLGLAFAKYQDFPYDFSINVFGKEIDEYYKVVKAALEKIEPELGRKAFHIPHGMVNLPEGKMSSRSGNVVTFATLMEEAKKQALIIMKDIKMEEAEKQKVSEVVALSAVRYAFLKSSLGRDVVFDFGKSISFEGDSGPYLLYTYARCKSVLRKAGSFVSSKLPKEVNTEEQALLRTLYRFPEIVVLAACTFSPNLLCAFLFDLAQKYNLFYDKHSILNLGIRNQGLGSSDRKSLVVFRLALTEVTASVIRKGLGLLGIKTVERM